MTSDLLGALQQLRRITIRKVRATLTGGWYSQSIGVPQVGLEEHQLLQQTHPGLLPLLPFLIPWVALQRGHGV